MVKGVAEDAGTPSPNAAGADPRAPLGHLSRLGFALRSAAGVDEIACSILRDLLALPGVRRVGFALSEGGGRRLRFVASDGPPGESLDWCLIDAYDDIPLTAVVRTGEPVLGSLDELEQRFPEVAARQREEGTAAMAVWPLPGDGAPLGGIVLFYDTAQSFPDTHRGLLEAACRRAADAVRRVRDARRRDGDDPWAADEDADDGERASVLLSSDARSVGIARGFLRETLADWDVEEDPIDTAQLCLSELVTNVVMHAGTTCELTVRLDEETLTVVVRDLGGESEWPGDYAPVELGEDEDPLQVAGRGLMLVDALADRWASEHDATGTTAWFALDLGGAATSGTEAG
jgi:anti-sigma regulatory factor (Ser/Thr protein kinase)